MSQTDQKKIVLLVDDAPANIQIVNSILKDIYKIRIATSGAKALELAKVPPPPDLILMDVMMPDMDGYEVCTRLKLDLETRGIPVIFLTGQTHVEEEKKGFDVGAVDYIHKPFSPGVVKARVQTHLMLRGIREQLARQLLTIQKELETARQIQFSILPSEIPTIEGLDIAARYVPMTSVAGDFYDFIVVDEKHIGILVADVSGHGMPAALIASMLKIALSTQEAHAADPAQVLLGLNQALCGKFQHHYVTAAYLFVDMQKRTLTYAGAGHPPLLLWGGSSKGVRAVMENGMFLGRFPFATYSSVELPLQSGARVLLYTDGVSETRNPAEVEFGTDRFRQFLEAEQSASADHFADRLLEELSRWSARGSAEDLDDDITMVAIHVKSD
jgi:sigma-B regulation protein RsbU (phosphoserine phosphatase)